MPPPCIRSPYGYTRGSGGRAGTGGLVERIGPESDRRLGRSHPPRHRRAARACGPISALVRGTGARGAGEPRPPVHVPGPLHAALGRVRARSGRRPSRRTRSASAARRGAELGPPVPAPGRCAARGPAARRRRTSAAPHPRARIASPCSTITCSVRPGARHASGRSPIGTRCCVHSSPAGADLILAGHIHQGAVSERHEFEVVEGDVRAACRLDRARARPATPEPARRGAGAARVRAGRANGRGAHLHLAGRRLGPHGT